LKVGDVRPRIVPIERETVIVRYQEGQRQKAVSQRDDGFTLIELLIVIVVLGILAAVVVFALGSVTSKGAKSACAADAKTVETAITAFQTQNPGTAVTQAALTTGTNASLKGWPSNIGPSYIALQQLGGTDATEVDVNASTASAQPAAGTSAAPNGWVKYDAEGTGTGCNAVT
jgi:prepilin-type N-terminal cleavage/methylation domain-containing protein